ncbi:hypothetical protein AMAG_04946 [Allomyces macrogynus ATCC 38327]|uniref:STAS domain-containing protein n=1 Tax=Allomyces macrogynus (strain ATCC 38327) TaxID=578462 RepID=A0A0L0S724_ALLM3|nr:hypothetical protein AMAG_04946 [Allomyces macrogynus ATCC 38327]|eukprot:KNE58129.1 hypothetical protein AMAG_04946 [Allomyces macrogynus ATCC 38327]
MQAPGAGSGAGAAGARPLIHARARPITPARNLVDESDSESVSAFDDDADDTSDQEWAAADDLPARARAAHHHHASSSSSSSTMPPAGVTAIPLPITETEPLLPASAARLRGERSWDATWVTLKTRARYYVPALSWIPNYDPRNLPHDFLAGATVALLLLPQGLSYASSLAKLDPVVGLYTAFAPVAFYAFFGTSRQLSVGPEALVSILVGSAITKNAVLRMGDGTEFNEEAVMAERATLAATLSLLVGIFTFMLGFFRFGFIDSMLSRALLRGFITAVALVIMIEQVPTLLGMPLVPGGLPALEPLPPVFPIPPTVSSTMYWSTGTAEAVEPDDDEPSAFDLFLTLLDRLHETHAPTLLLSIVSVAFLLITAAAKQRIADRFHRPWVKLIPEILILVVATITLSWAYDWRSQGIEILGRVRFSGLPVPRFPLLKPFSVIRGLTIPAILISVIGFVESIVVTKSYAGAHNYPVSRNRELVALGVANLAGAFFHAYPAFGSLARSRVADRVGARTQLAGLVAAALVLVAIFCLLPCFEYLPKAVMASIILVAALSLVETHDIAFMLQLHAWKDLMFMLFTFALTVFVSIEAGVLVSIALSLLLVVKDVAIPRITLLGRVRPATPAAIPTAHGTAIPPSVLAQRRVKYRSMANFQGAQIPTSDDDDAAGTVVVRIDEPLHFANTGELRDRLSRAERFGSLAAHPSETPRRRAPVRHVVFDVHHMPRIDASAVQILAEIVAQYRDRGVAVSFVRLRPALRKKFARAGITALVGEERFVRRIADALRVGAGGDGEGLHDAAVAVVEVGMSDRDAGGAEDHGEVSAETSSLVHG